MVVAGMAVAVDKNVLWRLVKWWKITNFAVRLYPIIESTGAKRMLLGRASLRQWYF